MPQGFAQFVGWTLLWNLLGSIGAYLAVDRLAEAIQVGNSSQGVIWWLVRAGIGTVFFMRWQRAEAWWHQLRGAKESGGWTFFLFVIPIAIWPRDIWHEAQIMQIAELLYYGILLVVGFWWTRRLK